MDTDLWQLRVDLLLLANGKILKAARMERYVRGLPADPEDGERADRPASEGVVAFRRRAKPSA